jgi:hypothetical protein
MRLRRRLQRAFNVKKPKALSWRDWQKWEEEFKSTRPVAYFFVEYLPARIDRANYLIFGKPTRALRRFANEYVYKTHMLDSTLERGREHGISDLLLFTSFNALVKYVEVDMAKAWVRFNTKENLLDDDDLSFKRRYWDPDSGIKYLSWMCSNERASAESAETATEVLILYKWWKNVRPTRPDAYVESGLEKYENELDNKYLGRDRVLNYKEQIELDKVTELCYSIDEEYDLEDDAMLIRLMKLRRRLWE